MSKEFSCISLFGKLLSVKDKVAREGIARVEANAKAAKTGALVLFDDSGDSVTNFSTGEAFYYCGECHVTPSPNGFVLLVHNNGSIEAVNLVREDGKNNGYILYTPDMLFIWVSDELDYDFDGDSVHLHAGVYMKDADVKGIIVFN